MAQFRNVLEDLRRRVRAEKATVIMGTKGIFGTTYEHAVKAQAVVDEYEKAIAILEAADAAEE